jgi:hypothetical protein
MKMAAAKTYDLNYRPPTYWLPDTDPKRIIVRIKGADRQRWAKEAIERGRGAELEDWMIQEKLSDELRNAAGRVHPRYMGGEYLPDCKRNEVEIARVTLQSSTQDVTSIRATRTSNRIKYRIVDEYDFGSIYEITPATSVQPLSMKRLISLMDTAKCKQLSWGPSSAGVVWIPLEGNLEYADDPMELSDFVEVTSEFYPGLQRYYAEEIDRFIRDFQKQKRR